MWYIKRIFLLGHLILQVMSEGPCPPSLQNSSSMNCMDKGAVKIVRLKNTSLSKLERDAFAKFPRLEEVRVTNAGLCNVDRLFRGLKNVRSIDLSENCVDHVTKTSFQNLPSLTRLSMKYNAITEIDEDAFSSLVSLGELYLSENHIEIISPKAFANGSSLRKLELYKNRMSHVGFLRNLNALEYLDLSSNSIGEVATDDFASMTHLLVLHCGHNRLSDLRFLKSAVNLFYLDLQHNQVETVPVDVFNAFTNASQIFLSHNRIAQIDSGTFSELKRLKNLDLSHNLLTHVGEILAYLPRLDSLHINGNGLKKFAITTSEKVTIFIDDNEWICEFVTRLCSTKNVILSYTFHKNVSHYRGIPCVDEVGTRRVGVDATETKEAHSQKQFYVYLSVFAGALGVLFATVFASIIFMRKIIRKKRDQEGDTSYRTFARSEGGYMTPIPACQNIYEEIHDVASIIRPSDSCTDCTINNTI